MGKIVCVGVVKTATTSLLQAFERLGYRCASWDADMILAWHQGDVERCLGHAAEFQFLRDWPWQQLYQQLDARYPGSQFILTTREPQDWVVSFVSHLRRNTFTADGLRIPHPLRDKSRCLTYGFDPTHHLEDRSYLIKEVYERHNASVRQYFSGRGRALLEVNLTGNPSYRSICQFIGVPVVDWEFPHANKRPG